jgi:N-acetylglucosamine-6-phosphate deacetylase
VTSSNILHGSANPIGGQNQVIKLRWGMGDEQLKFTEAPQGIKFALGENVKQSNRPTPGTRYPRTRMGVEQIIRDAFRAGEEYQVRHDNWNKTHAGLPPRVDLEMEAIAEILRHERLIHCHSYRQDEILALLRLLDEHGIQIGTLQHILEGYKVAEALAEHGAMASAFADWWAYKVEVYDGIPYAGAIMHKMGICVSFNSDDAELARHLNHEAAKAVRYGGVSEIEALKFVTLNPARQLRIDPWVGSIEAGKHADLVLWSGNPLALSSRCEQTWIDGRKYFDRIEEATTSTTQAEMRRTLIQKILASGQKMTEPGEEKVDPATLWPRHDEYCGHHHDDDDENHSLETQRQLQEHDHELDHELDKN